MLRFAPFAVVLSLAGSARAAELDLTLITTAGDVLAEGEITRRVTIPASGPVRLVLTGDLKPSRLRRGGY